MRAIPIANGERFGRLIVTAELPSRPVGQKGEMKRYVMVACDCGATTEAALASLKRGGTQSCGCLKRETDGQHFVTHGGARTAEYTVWKRMIKRTTNRRNPVFRLYGGRGIKVCARWRHDFAAFLSDMGRRPSALHSIDRIDNEGDYEPRNCRWATPKEQSGNTRRNRWLEFNGRRMICSDWAAEMGMSPQTLYKRLKAGWSVSRSLTAPVVARP